MILKTDTIRPFSDLCLIGLPCVVTIAVQGNIVDSKRATVDGVEICEAMNRLADAGADVVGLNCALGPQVMLSVLEQAVKVCKVSSSKASVRGVWPWPPTISPIDQNDRMMKLFQLSGVSPVDGPCLAGI